MKKEYYKPEVDTIWVTCVWNEQGDLIPVHDEVSFAPDECLGLMTYLGDYTTGEDDMWEVYLLDGRYYGRAFTYSITLPEIEFSIPDEILLEDKSLDWERWEEEDIFPFEEES